MCAITQKPTLNGQQALSPGGKKKAEEIRRSLFGGPIDPAFIDDGWTRLTRNVKTLASRATEQVSNLVQLADFKTMEEIRGLVDETVKDPETADKLKAYYNQFCKRPTFNDHYLATLNRDNVELVDVSSTQGVEAITERGIVANGKEYEVDCIIYASGFEITSSYERRLGIPIFGMGAIHLQALAGWNAQHAWPNGERVS